jgi:hypothetical protein
MTHTTNTQTYILPAHWASAIINADNSGLEDSDIADIQDFMERVKPGYCVGCSEEPYFAHWNDYNNIGGNMLDFTFRID